MDSQLEAFEKFKASGGGEGASGGDRKFSRHSGGQSTFDGPMPDLYSIHHGKVVRVEGKSRIRYFGAFVQLPGYKKHGLVHKTQASKHFTENIADVVAVGDHVWVKVTSVQDDKIALSMKYVSQGNGEDLDPNLVQQTGAEDKRRVHSGFMDKAPIAIEQGGVLLKTVCKKCGAAGHLAVECFSGGEKFELLVDDDEEAEGQYVDSSNRSRTSDRKKKKDREGGDRGRKSGGSDRKEKRESKSHRSDKRRGRSRSPSPRRRADESRGSKVESLEDALAVMRAHKEI
ncbi:Nucleolar protein of 40 kDa [Mortierella sp. GBA30]|nr:Nucleolar protein of 40 kDa [Mortierella sp. GBA30]